MSLLVLGMAGLMFLERRLLTTFFYSNISNHPTSTVNFVGQRFLLADGTEVFVASAFFEMEVYRDLE
ncbi:hypothetical protein G4O51_04020 [Candidatus Bathyarchaeota archaeon A05DMB-2]|jgi:hypothetical protein|nr:hypothetical protein [Candidatus Bathyarchaeota archaeon A05DMB-2]